MDPDFSEISEQKGKETSEGYSRRVYTTLISHGMDIDFNNAVSNWFDAGDDMVVRHFFQDSDYPPSSSFGQFIQLVMAEHRCAEQLGFALRKMKGHKPSTSILQSRTVLGEIRRVRKEIGQAIFGEEHEAYAGRTKTVFTTHRGGQNKQALETRRRNINGLVTDVKTHFPLTSR